MAGTRRRVVILVENLPVPLDRRVWQEAQALRDAGWSVTIIGPRGAGTMRAWRERLEGIEVLRYPQRAASGLRGYLAEYVPSMIFTFWWLLFARMRGPIHVIHGCNPPDLFWLFGRLGRLWGARYVFDQHDANPELSQTKFGEGSAKGRLLHAATRELEQRSYDAASLVIAPNDSYAELAAARGGVPADRLTVVRSAPDVATYRCLASGTRPDPHAVGYVGVMGSQDGLETLVNAWSLVVREPDMPDARLELVGDGESRPGLERLAERLGIRASVRFHGYQRPASFVPVLAACALCVSPDPPTPFNDVSTMVKVVDYLAIGRPIVAFDLRETRLVAGEAVRVVQPATAHALAAAILSLMRDDEALGRMRAAAEARVSDLQLDWHVSAARLTAAYDRLVPATSLSTASGSAAAGPSTEGPSTDGRPTPR